MAQPAATARATSGLRQLVRQGIAGLQSIPLSLHLLLFRLAIASVFLPAGWLKLAGWESTIALFQEEYKVPVLPPALAATLATTFEIGCSALLIAGLATRLATLPLLAQILTIQLFVYPQAWHEHLVWGAILLFVLTRGAGAASLDHLVGRRLIGHPGP